MDKVQHLTALAQARRMAAQSQNMQPVGVRPSLLDKLMRAQQAKQDDRSRR